MENQIYNLCSPLMRLKPLTLFLLTTIPLIIQVAVKGTPSQDMAGRILTSIGSIILFAWVYAVGMKSIETLNSQGIYISIYKFFNWIFLLTLFFYLFTQFAMVDHTIDSNRMQFHFVTPIYIPIISIFGFFVSCFITGKLLVSAELKREAEFKDYFTTILLFMIASIGLWFIQPRIQKL